MRTQSNPPLANGRALENSAVARHAAAHCALEHSRGKPSKKKWSNYVGSLNELFCTRAHQPLNTSYKLGVFLNDELNCGSLGYVERLEAIAAAARDPNQTIDIRAMASAYMDLVLADARERRIDDSSWFAAKKRLADARAAYAANPDLPEDEDDVLDAIFAVERTPAPHVGAIAAKVREELQLTVCGLLGEDVDDPDMLAEILGAGEGEEKFLVRIYQDALRLSGYEGPLLISEPEPLPGPFDAEAFVAEFRKIGGVLYVEHDEDRRIRFVIQRPEQSSPRADELHSLVETNGTARAKVRVELKKQHWETHFADGQGGPISIAAE